jgi:small subunit ribosomal protein S9
MSEKAKKPVLETGKRKTAIAKAVLRQGKGRVYVNNFPLETIVPEIARVKTVDLRVSVEGGGVMGQAEAARIAIARSLAGWTRSGELRKAYLAFDRVMLAGDHRTTEPKKFGGPGPRRRKQKSYR